MSKSDELSKTFGQRLKLLREKADLSQSQLAKELSVSRGAISFYENGERCPSIDFLYDTAEFFDVSYDYLMGKSSCENPENLSKITFLSDDSVRFLEAYQNTIYNKYSPSWDLLNYVFSHPNAAQIIFLFTENIVFTAYCLRKISNKESFSDDDLNQLRVFTSENTAYRFSCRINEIINGAIDDIPFNLLSENEQKQFIQFYHEYLDAVDMFSLTTAETSAYRSPLTYHSLERIMEYYLEHGNQSSK